MPEMDGFETAEEIRKSDTDVSIVFVLYYTITNAGKGFEVAAEDFYQNLYCIEKLRIS